MEHPAPELQSPQHEASPAPEPSDAGTVYTWRRRGQVRSATDYRIPALEKPDSSGGPTSFVADSGIAQQLAHEVSETGAEASSEAPVSDAETRHAGGHLSSQPNRPPDLSDAGLDQTPHQEDLCRELRKAIIKPTPFNGESEDPKYVPRDEHEKIITPERMEAVLKAETPPSPGGWEQYIKEIYGPVKVEGIFTSRRIIFSTLCLMHNIQAISKFVDGKIYDKHLPLRRIDGADDCDLACDGSEDPIDFIKDEWREPQCDLFLDYQWQFLAPIFQLSTPQQGKFNHYELKPKVALPVLSKYERPDEAKYDGGFGDVRRVEFHPAHLRHEGKPSDKLHVAIKRLKASDDVAQGRFDVELKALKKVTKQRSPYLTSLLFTFNYQSCFHFAFEWAENGNLKDLWEAHPETSKPARTHKFSIEFTKHILGLARGLQTIHKCPVKDANISDAQKYGFHGDVKPANILCFSGTEQDQDSIMGVLKFSDFGMTTFHGTQSIDQVSPIGVSRTYMPPELELAETVTQKYDIWSFGCVILEMITWHLQGYDGVKRFAISRVEETRPKFEEDYFFTKIHRHQPPTVKKKKTVNEHFDKLYEAELCSDLVWEILNFTEKRLLRVHPERRVTIEEAVQFLQEAVQKCENDESYAIGKTQYPKPERSSTDDSSINGRFLSLQPYTTNSTNMFQNQTAVDTDVAMTDQSESRPQSLVIVPQILVPESSTSPSVVLHSKCRGPPSPRAQSVADDVPGAYLDNYSEPDRVHDCGASSKDSTKLPGSSDGGSTRESPDEESLAPPRSFVTEGGTDSGLEPGDGLSPVTSLDNTGKAPDQRQDRESSCRPISPFDHVNTESSSSGCFSWVPKVIRDFKALFSRGA